MDFYVIRGYISDVSSVSNVNFTKKEKRSISILRGKQRKMFIIVSVFHLKKRELLLKESKESS